MANPEHLEILGRSVKEWNRWREDNPDVKPGLWRANLSDADLRGADLSEAYLLEACLIRADLSEACLCEADLRWADLRVVP
jgi:uncharacterized protein YjbI with pentapeptide repeats